VPLKNMVRVPGGRFLMGSDEFYPEEQPVHEMTVDRFWMDEHLVTVAEFRRFVKATDYVTLAERAPKAEDYPSADPALLVPGSLVFKKTHGPVDLHNFRNWWEWKPGAYWRRPEGPGSDLNGRDRHPIVHVAYEDAEAYATWAGKELPTEAEWEFAARGGLDGATFAWGDDFAPSGRMMANTWQGEFPWQNLLTDRYEGTSPVKSFLPNGYGLYDVTGNVWEWTTDLFEHPDATGEEHACCAPGGLRDDFTGQGHDHSEERIPRKVIKGGSHLCAPNYCLRYRPAARQAEAVDTSTGHIGFRCIVRMI
jgi:formylglycine-generating enzyme